MCRTPACCSFSCLNREISTKIPRFIPVKHFLPNKASRNTFSLLRASRCSSQHSTFVHGCTTRVWQKTATLSCCRELLGGQSQLTAFLSEWDGPLPRGFRALASAKGISLRQPFSPPAACLQAMHQKLGRVFLPESLEV